MTILYSVVTGDDIFTTGAGSDLVLGYAGDDAITIDGAGDKTIDGGAGTDTATISIDGITSLTDYVTRSIDEDYILTLVDADNNTLSLKNILNFSFDAPASGLTIGNTDYVFLDYPYDNTLNTSDDNLEQLWCSMHGQYAGVVRGVAADLTNMIFIGYDTSALEEATSSTQSQNAKCSTFITQTNVGTSQGKYPMREDYRNTAMTIHGYSHSDYVISSTQNDTIYTYAGDDKVLGSKGIDTIDLGSGNDVAFIETTDINNDTINGGDGIDTLSFARVSVIPWFTTLNDASYRHWDHDIGVTVDLDQLLSDSTKSISGFENLVGTEGSDTLSGDTNANVLIGGLGSDTLSGQDGNDILYDDVNEPLSNVEKGRTSCSDSGYVGIYGTCSTAKTDYASGNDILYGNAGDDTLIASNGDDTLDGGTGADTLTGGAGIDTFVIRSGDGGSSISDADTITDFTDGTDLIGIDGLIYNDLIRETSGSDVVIKYNDEILTTISNTTLANIDYYDIVSTSTDIQTLTGTSGDDNLLGGSGNDIFTTGAGSDLVLGYAGDDAITIDGAGDKTIDGGAGTNTATISIDGITSLTDYVTRSIDEDYILTLVDADNNTLSLKNILNFSFDAPASGLTIGNTDYVFLDYPYDNTLNTSDDNLEQLWCSMHGQYAGVVRGVAADLTNMIFIGYDTSALEEATSSTQSQNAKCSTFITQTNVGTSQGKYPMREDYRNTAMTIHGYSHSDYVISSTQNDTIYTYAGDDKVLGSKGIDTIDLGSGNDVAFIETTDINNDTINGGDGIDTLSFARVSVIPWFTTLNDASYRHWDHDIGVTVDLDQLLSDSTKSISGFENLVGTEGSDTLSGDTNANVLIGGLGSDTLSGQDGNDILYDDVNEPLSNVEKGRTSCSDSGYVGIYGTCSTAKTDYASGNDILYGGAGDDTLIASNGDDTLDGGTGADTLQEVQG